MRAANAIKYEVLKQKHSHRYGDVSKLNTMVYFEAVEARNRFSIA